MFGCVDIRVPFFKPLLNVKSIFLLYIKLFFIFGITFGVFMLLLDLVFGNGWDPNVFLFRFIYFGGGMSIVLGTGHLFRVKYLGGEITSIDDLQVRQTRRIISNVGIPDLIGKLMLDPKLKRMDIQVDGMVLKLQSDMSLASWGETMKIKVQPEDDGLFSYEVTSVPKLKTTLVDFGQNLRNVMRVEKLLKNHS